MSPNTIYKMPVLVEGVHSSILRSNTEEDSSSLTSLFFTLVGDDRGCSSRETGFSVGIVCVRACPGGN